MAAGPNVGGGKRGSAAQTVGVLNLLTDLAFNLLIFFVVLASTEPEKGRPQEVPSSKNQQADQQAQNIEIKIARTTVTVNGQEVPVANLSAKLQEFFVGKTKPDDRVVIVKSDGDTPYYTWIKVTGIIEKAGGVITLQLEEGKKN